MIRLNTRDTIRKVKKIISSHDKVVVAFSGGVDSSLLLKLAVEALGRKNVIPVIGVSALYPEIEIKLAGKIAKACRVPLRIVKTDELKNRRFRKNPRNRCYICKKYLFIALLNIAKQNNCSGVIEGSNRDDLDDFRPGMKAVRELHIQSPFLEARVGKDEIRKAAKALGLSVWDKPSFACLASRFPYGEMLNDKTLKMIQKGEAYLRKLGFAQVRIRTHNTVARIEVESKEIPRLSNERIRTKVCVYLRKIGYTYVCVDLRGFRSGSMNEV
ncbi:ATP-dependent sacrificial sulfur transferase LarE [Spirochaetota bacterium]